MHFDWSIFPEYWGSIHLIAPNPVFRHFQSRPDRTGEQLEVVVAFELRRGKSVNGLEYEVESRHASGTAYVVRKRLEAPVERIALPGEPEEVFERVHDGARGLLYELGPFNFDFAFAGTLNLSTEVRRVSVPRGDGSDETYSVPLVGGFSTSMQIGEPRKGRDGAARLWFAKRERARRNRGLAEQKWFRNQVADATAELRKLVGNGTQPLFLVDPYFGGDDLLRVLLAVRDPDVRIDVLVGAEHLRKRHPTQAGSEADHLSKRLGEAGAAGRMNPIEIRVMRGSSPEIHDRLLLIGDELWVLGSSLNAYGSRGTLLVKAPDPEPVMADVRNVWRDSKPFPTWLAERQQHRNGPADE